MKSANELALAFSNELSVISYNNAQQAVANNRDDDIIHIQTTGASLTELYESLRNASQNAEENLLLMHAIERFLERYFSGLINITDNIIKQSGKNLIIELTMAGYLRNDSIHQPTANQITSAIRSAITLKNRYTKQYSKAEINRWIVQPLSAQIESLLRDHTKQLALANLAYNYFLQAIDIDQMTDGNRPATYEAMLYIASQKALLKSDEAAIRLNLLQRYGVTMAQYVNYARFNQQIDTVFADPVLDKLVKLINRHGAPFRIIGRTVATDDSLAQHIREEKTFLGPYDSAIRESYVDVNKSVNRGILRSVIFLIITKFLIGIAIEVPYDIAVHHQVMWLPLGVNLLLPPIYMIMLRLTLIMPDARNTKALTREASRILYSPLPTEPFITGHRRSYGKAWNVIYALFVIGVFVTVGWLLMKFAHFEWIHLAIFFVFISTASFLGFRLSRSIREIEVGDEAQTSATILRDFIYMPFVAVGQKISETYSQINIVSRLLDMFVELPLKTILGFFRRWGNFMSAKRDDL